MSVALQVLLLVVATVVAVAGLGVALALRLSARQRKLRHRAAKAGHAAAAPAAAKMAGGSVIPLPRRPRPSVAPAPAAAPAEPLTPEQAHKAKLAALQAMLALGDAKAERAAKNGKMQFADTEPADDDYANTQFVDRADASKDVSLLNLDRVPGSAPRSARSGR